MSFHLAWVVLLYAALTFVRAPAVWGIRLFSDNPDSLAAIEQRISANVRNQFEWPMFFYVACLLQLLGGTPSSLFVTLAWVFIAGRVLHTLVQVFTTNVRLRGLVFTVNFVAVLLMWGVLLYGQSGYIL